MKNTCFNLIGLSLLLGIGSAASAQSVDESKTSIQIRVTERKEGKTQVNERRYEMSPMSDATQKIFIDKVLDSLGVDGNGQQQVSIIVNDNAGKLRMESRGPGDQSQASSRQRVGPGSRQGDEPVTSDPRDGDDSFRFDADELRGSVRRMQKELEPKLNELRRNMEPGLNTMHRKLEGMGDRMSGFWPSEGTTAGSVRLLSAYPNNPDNGMLNLRFSTSGPGDVYVSVTDTQGREVGKKIIKDFDGEFVGQIEIKKTTKGTLFVTVVQNEDGAVRRVVLK